MNNNNQRIKTLPMVGTEAFNCDISEFLFDALLTENTKFEGALGGNYEIMAKPIIKIGGEAQIFHCMKEKTDEKYVAKIYTLVMPSRSEDRKREKVINFLLKCNDNSKKSIMPLIDYGVITLHDGRYEQPHYIEIMPFCEDGDLGKSKKIDYDILVSKVIPNINRALYELHKENFIHRDIKPENLYWYKGEVVLGDFGITTEADEVVSSRTTQQRGSLGYSAPELFSNSAIKESDYYSFGQTIATLYMGKHMYQNQLSWEDDTNEKKEEKRKAVYDYMLKDKIFLELQSEEHEYFKELIHGLLRYSPSNRFGYEIVNKWLSGDQSIKMSLHLKDSVRLEKFERPFKFEDSKYAETKQDLDELLLSNWESSKEYLYEGKIEKYFDREDQSLAMHANRVVNSLASENENVGLSMFLHKLNNGNGFCWYGKRYANFGEISENMQKCNDSDIFIELVSSGLLSWHLENLKDQNENNIKIIRDIETVAKSYPEIGFHYAKFKLSADEEGNRYLDCSSIDEVFEHLICEENYFISEGIKLIRDPEFYGYMIYLGYRDHSLNLLEKTKFQNKADEKNNLENLEHFFNYLDVLISDMYKKLLRKYYITSGSKAHLKWWKDNLDLYSFNGNHAKELKSLIENVEFTSKDTMSDISEKFISLEHLLNEFIYIFYNDIFLSHIGIFEDKDVEGITSKALDAFFVKKYNDQLIPIGFLNYLEKKN